MIKTLLGIGDIHLRKKDFYEVGFKEFLEWFDKKFPDEGREFTEILLAGDVFDKISMLPSVAAMALEMVNLFFRKAKNVYAILGNHDYGLHHYKVENTKSLLTKLNVKVIDNPCELKTELGFEVLCLPWVYGMSFSKVNNFISSLEPKEYDACTAHWELSPLFGEADDFVDLSNVKAKSFMCGHIHSHNSNPKYLGSILPNNVSEGKEMDNSVIKALSKDFDSGKFKEHELPIPSFIHIASKEITSLNELEILPRDPLTFYKIFHRNSIPEKLIYQQAQLIGLNIYATERISDENETEPQGFQEIAEYSVSTTEDLIKLYKDAMQISDEDMAACMQIIKSVA